MGPRKVIVFGATGDVGSAAARTAHSHGAKVFLALRDITKPVPGLTATEEQSAGYERVQADLTQPDTVRTAVSKTGATHAFIYAALGSSSDHWLSTAEALKAGGIELVVLLSSFTVQGDIRAIPQSDFIGYAHANSRWWQKQIVEDGEVKWAFPDLKVDYISPDDIGAVCGTILAGAFKGEHETSVFLCGPETDLSVADAIETIGRAINKPVKVTKVSTDENIKVMVEKSGTPEPLARLLTDGFALENQHQGMLRAETPEIRGNIERYLGRPAMRFSEWVERNKDKFSA
ncbi:hypothetical protein AN0992.2 [Aspergillus nidulans FGSC A4]|uniref:NmrA-like family protein (AFU_orthologue AFUA_8G01860) n=1 Tax=Emericella nidulans (strain FGSC A4 / ATCC 38163 / CBS 112.46 / NRRL 194 / M139) TaxID=227321 RepID=Q5BEN8_EMENI|nr:hypothetical protein [Aspergillus nidulans FGSC A4]EAA65560.1 hypothetical protein AN0992.2 [Aspergillus nidulans FGSC A4]CBF88380.1 TPA: NmrA-like family protein (AFU_orthologue; AFUA_8G01860) [Aspergillus nidulans FGSC A4]|eukprot:XP_658596.1 hypothetical protein AN0992.2 [Aspergillus nidulans FGSC A4]